MYQGDAATFAAAGQVYPPLSWQRLAFATIPGATGHVIVLAMVLMYVTAKFRGKFFNLFWYVHHFYIVVIVVTCFHGECQIDTCQMSPVTYDDVI